MALRSNDSNITLTLDAIPKVLTSTRADKINLKRILSNIIQNSIEAISGSGNIHVVVKKSKDKVKIEIADDGCGIEREVLKKVFEKGFTKGKSNGSGLGLAYAKKMIEFWNGKIHVISKPGKGTKILITLPVEKSEAKFICDVEALTSKSRFIAMLDDSELWLKRGEAFDKGSQKLIAFSDPDALIGWADTQAKVGGIDDISFVIDFDLKSHLNGVEVIDRLGIRKQSVLLTESYSDAKVVSLCGARGVPIAPKSLAFSRLDGF
ncbi:MAG: ATP-binding protein [Bdellovibrionales bacterium]|nr:ATP-binding protein [Bdellovibrionales bacterium]